MTDTKQNYNDLKAVFINCTLKKGTETSNTEALMRNSMQIMEKNGVSTTLIRSVNHAIAPGVYPDMREKGWDKDEWPELFKTIIAADILVVGTPIWLGEKSSECTKIIERLYAHSSETNDKGQYLFYGRVGGCIITGNEDGMKHCGMNILYSLQHIGYTIPPQADAGWVGEAGPGPSYLDEGSGGPENDFTQRNTTFMAWNLMHIARMLKDNGGIPGYGNQTDKWEAGEHFGHP